MSDTLNPDQPDKESADTGARAEGEQSNAESRRAFIKKLAYTHLPCRLLSWSMAASRVMTTTTMVAARVGAAHRRLQAQEDLSSSLRRRKVRKRSRRPVMTTKMWTPEAKEYDGRV